VTFVLNIIILFIDKEVTPGLLRSISAWLGNREKGCLNGIMLSPGELEEKSHKAQIDQETYDIIRCGYERARSEGGINIQSFKYKRHGSADET